MTSERRKLPRTARLRASADFDRVHREGGRLQRRHLVIRYRRSEQNQARFGLSVSRRVGNAVVRNRVKRWLREAIRHERGGLTGVDVVLIARTTAATAGCTVLRHEVAGAFELIRSGR